MVKKSFKENINPAMNFISQESIARTEGEPPTAEKTQRPAKAPEGYKFNPLYIETKSERLHLLIQPSLKAKLKKKAKTESISVNELVNSILYDALLEEKSDIRY